MVTSGCSDQSYCLRSYCTTRTHTHIAVRIMWYTQSSNSKRPTVAVQRNSGHTANKNKSYTYKSYTPSIDALTFRQTIVSSDARALPAVAVAGLPASIPSLH